MRFSLRGKLILSYLFVIAAFILVQTALLLHGWRALAAALPTEELDLWHRLGLMLLSTLGLAVLIAFVLGIKLAADISSPLEEVTRAARRLAQGDFSVRLRTDRRDETGELSAAFTHMSDALKTRLEETNAAKARLEALLNNTVSGLMLLDIRGRVVLVNPAAERLFHLRPGSALGKHCIEVVRDYDLNASVSEALKQGQVVEREITLLYPVERTIRAHVAPVGEEAIISGVIVVLHDITELRRLERMRTEFVASVSHELRTPLTAIRGFTETLLSGALEDKAAAERFLRIIADEARRLSALIDDLLDLSRLELKRANLNIATLNLTSLVEDTAFRARPRLEKADLTLNLDLPGDLPPVQGDKDRLRQVLLNLLDNAIKYTPARGSITARARREGDWVRVEVEDTGRGIPAQDLDRIFERFYRVDKARSRSEGGTGLGLAIVKHIVELHGGRVWAQSQVGKGTTIAFTVPVAKEA